MTIRLLHTIAFTVFTILMFFWLSQVLTGYVNLAYGYTTMSIDINQLVDEGALQVVDEPQVMRVLGVEQLDADRFGDELATRYSGMEGGWFIASAGAWLAFFVLVYFSLYQWVILFRHHKSGADANKP